jgi:hypothetical protein
VGAILDLHRDRPRPRAPGRGEHGVGARSMRAPASAGARVAGRERVSGDRGVPRGTGRARRHRCGPAVVGGRARSHAPGACAGSAARRALVPQGKGGLAGGRSAHGRKSHPLFVHQDEPRQGYACSTLASRDSPIAPRRRRSCHATFGPSAGICPAPTPSR